MNSSASRASDRVVQEHAPSAPAAEERAAGRYGAIIGVLALVLGSCLFSSPTQAQVVNPNAVEGKVLVGYQGWFRCPGDGSPRNGWVHWSNGPITENNLTVDGYPDLTTEFNKAQLCSIPNMTVRGQQAYLFSSMYKQTADIHFNWMRTYGIDGALIQRFTGEIGNLRRENDVVLKNLKAAAETTGRVFAIEYDLSRDYSNLTDDAVVTELQNDWNYLVNTVGVTRSASYLKHKGKPLVSLWGLGFDTSGHVRNPVLAERIIRWFKEQAGVSVMGGVQAGWNVGGRGSSPDPRWPNVYKQLDIVQPWAVGAFVDKAGADRWRAEIITPDLNRTRSDNQLYMPVVFPGFSWYNLRGHVPTSPQNQIKRDGGQFLWHQAYNAKSAGAAVVKIAMFDEVDEATSIFKMAPTRLDAPNKGYWLTLDADGKSLPSDWYLRLAYEIGRVYRGQTPATATMPTRPGPR